jgi:hypothetical protein
MTFVRITKQRFSWCPWQRHGNKFKPDEAAKEKKRLEKKGWSVIICALKEDS